MAFIHTTWREYFTNHHEGLGTTYERFILQRYFEKIKSRYSVQSVLEVPSFGMTGISGINSLWWAAQGGARVVVMDVNKERVNLIQEVWNGLSMKASIVYQPSGEQQLPFGKKAFDLAWNFAALWYVPDLEGILKELIRISCKAVFICIPNTGNIFYQGRVKELRKSKEVYPDNIDPARIEKIMRDHGWQCDEKGYFDVPPWPDIAMKKEDMLKMIGLKKLAGNPQNGTDQYLCILDYFSGKKKNMPEEILKYGFLENSPLLFKKFWAHHQYFVFTPQGGK